MTYMLAIDPGEVRWGTAIFTDHADQPYVPLTGPLAGWHCCWVAVLDRDRAQDWLDDHLKSFEVDVLVFERWVLYPDKLETQTGSECGTAESIGVIKWLVKKRNRQLDRCPPGQRPAATELVALPAAAKNPVPALMRAAGIESKAKELSKRQGGSTHDTLAAEQLGWAWLFQTKRVTLPA